MRLTSKGRYAVMAVADLASHGEGRPVALCEIAGRQDISLSYLEQLFARLRRGGVVKSVRGPGGGYVLARAASAIAVIDIVRAMEAPEPASRCSPNAPESCPAERCQTHALWHGLGQQIERFLSAVSLADVCEGRIPRPGAVQRAEQPTAPLAAE